MLNPRRDYIYIYGLLSATLRNLYLTYGPTHHLGCFVLNI
jgi:hypothetical protein